jgi:hypothetical protein
VGASRVHALSFATFYVTAISSSFNVSASIAIRRHRESGLRLRVGLAPLLAAVLVACAPKPEPRTVSDFMDDGLAREGVLTRCNQNREETLNDEECTNARRAAATLALEAERARTPQLEERSAARQVAMRQDDSPPTLGRPSLKIEAVAPPSNDLVITAPPLDVPKLAVAPRPLRDETAQR